MVAVSNRRTQPKYFIAVRRPIDDENAKLISRNFVKNRFGDCDFLTLVYCRFCRIVIYVEARAIIHRGLNEGMTIGGV
jgi:hypothetical protein